MDANDYQTPDLASVLKTLRAYAPSNAQFPDQQHTHDLIPSLQAEVRGDGDFEEGEYDPGGYDPTQPQTSTFQRQSTPRQLPFNPQPDYQHSTPQQHQQRPPPTQQPPQPAPKKTYPTTAYPPSTITTWAPALRHITTLSASNPEFTLRIRPLITIQHTHERQWHAGRLALLQKLSAREASRSKLDSVLGSLGGNIEKRSREDELTPEQELIIYDRKVYKACQEMEAASVGELERLEVPFFCTMGELISEQGEKRGQKRKGTVSREELAELRGRTVQLLEDLCGG